jgi:hypothetical protein
MQARTHAPLHSRKKIAVRCLRSAKGEGRAGAVCVVRKAAWREAKKALTPPFFSLWRPRARPRAGVASPVLTRNRIPTPCCTIPAGDSLATARAPRAWEGPKLFFLARQQHLLFLLLAFRPRAPHLSPQSAPWGRAVTFI